MSCLLNGLDGRALKLTSLSLGSLLVKAREIDVIIAADASADTEYFCEHWTSFQTLHELTSRPTAGPNGTSLLATAERVRDHVAGFTSFPPIPGSAKEFVDQGLNTRPTFFGCNITTAANMSSLSSIPLVVYLPSAPPPTVTADTYLVNVSTFTLNYAKDDVVSFLDAAHANGMKGFQNGTTQQDSEWPLALKCAVVDRARSRAMIPRSAVCERLFTRCKFRCWSLV